MDWDDCIGAWSSDHLLFAADTHFDADGAWLDRGIVGDAEHAFSRLVDHAVTQHAPVCLGGDIVNRPDAHPASIGPVFRQVDRLAEAGLPLYYVLGQHDGRKDWLSAHGWPTHLHGRTFSAWGLRFAGLDCLPAGEYREALATLPADVDVLITHQVWRDLLGTAKDKDLMALAEIPPQVRIVLTGDYHKPVVKRVKRPHGELVAYSPGSMAMQALDEPEDKQYYLFSRGMALGMPVSYPSRPVIRRSTFDADAAMLAAVTASAKASKYLPPILLRPILIMPAPESVAEERRARKALSDVAHVFFTRPAAADVADLRAKAAEIRQVGLEGALTAVLPPGSTEFTLAVALLNAANPAAELEARKAAFLGGAVAGADA